MEQEQVQKRRFRSEEVALHRGLDDAWVVVDGEVYDVTEFLQSHPGGPEVSTHLADLFSGSRNS